MYLRKQPKKAIIESYVSGLSNVKVECFARSKMVCILKNRRGQASDLICSCEGPYKIEPSDVPEDIVKEVPSFQWLLTLVLSHSKATDRRFAKNLAKFLCDTYEGVAFDTERDLIIWPKGKRRKTRLSDKKTPVDIVKLDWFLAASRNMQSVGEKMIEVCCDLCREALPIRYGDSEPLQRRFDIEQTHIFLWAMEETCGSGKGPGPLFWEAKHPFLGGSISRSFARKGNVDGVERIKLTFSLDCRYLEYEDYQRLLQRLFVRMARDLCAFYGAGYVLRGYLAGRTLWATAKTEQPPFPKGDVWLGLPDLPSWLTWYGSPYAPYVKPTLREFVQGHYPEGLFVAYGNEPLSVEQLRNIALKIPDELVLKREETSANIEDMGKLVAAGFKDIAFAPSGSIVGCRSIRADFIPMLGP
jgi:hypothetical protein